MQTTAAHNYYRSQISGIPNLYWSTSLESDSQQWADFLANSLLFEHSGAPNVGENLWMGPPSTSPSSMTDGWGNEKQYFVYGIFPQVSTTGNWADVGHYTQIIWKNTVSVGCGGATGSDGFYRFVCRYSPAGNVVDEVVY